MKPLAWYTGWQGRSPRMVMFKPQASFLLTQSAYKNFHQARMCRTMNQPSIDDGLLERTQLLCFVWYVYPLKKKKSNLTRSIWMKPCIEEYATFLSSFLHCHCCIFFLYFFIFCVLPSSTQLFFTCAFYINEVCFILLRIC